jgi:environmental stress-induced protein Ves
MRIIRAADCKTTPWKNGGGSTTEIAAAPEGVSMNDFDWRISMAQVASDGPFSDFPGIDRTLTVIAGSGMVLTVGDGAPVTLSRGSAPLSFAGDVPTSARLTAGPITDLNVMTRRGRFGHAVRRMSEAMDVDFGDNEVAVVLSLGGESTVESVMLGHGDAVVVDAKLTRGFRIASVGGDCWLVLLRKQHRQ